MAKGTAEKRIYIVTTKKLSSPERLVRGLTKAQAMRFVADSLLHVEVAKQVDLVRLLPTTKIEEAVESEQEVLAM